MSNEAQPEVFGSEPKNLALLSDSTAANASADRKFRLALVLYMVLAALVWFTMSSGEVMVHGRSVQLRLVPLIIIGGLALRTVVAHQADKIRRQSENGSRSL